MPLRLLHGTSRVGVPLTAAVTLLVVSACRAPAPAQPASPMTPAPAPAPAPQAAPPRCEALSEGCAATAETVLAVPSSLTFTPPLGWRYAAEPSQAAARSPDGKALLAFTASSGDLQRKDDRVKIITRLEGLVLALGVSEVDFARLEKRLQKPDTKIEEEGSFPIKLWEVGSDQQGGRSPVLGNIPGTVLIVVSTTPTGLLLLGAAFVTPEAAADQAPKVMDAVKSLRLVQPGAPEAPAKSEGAPPPAPEKSPNLSARAAERPM